MNEFIKQFYSTYAPDVEIDNRQANDVSEIYKGNMLKFAVDFENSYIKPKGQKFQKDLYQQIYDNQKLIEKRQGEKQEAPKEPIPYKPEERGINDWLDSYTQWEDQGKGLKKKTIDFFSATSKHNQQSVLNEKYGPYGFEAHNVLRAKENYTDHFVFRSHITGEEIIIDPNKSTAQEQLTNFVKKNAPKKGSPEYKKAIKLEQERIALSEPKFLNTRLSAAEIKQIENQTLNNPDLFKPLVVTRGGEPSFSPYSGFVGTGGVTKKTQKVIQPHEEILRMAKINLENKNEKLYTGEITQKKIEDEARNMLYNKEKDKQQLIKDRNFLEDLSQEERDKYGLGFVELYQDQDAENLSREEEDLNMKITFFKADPDYKFIKAFQDGTMTIRPPEEGEEVLELKNGEKIPQGVYNEYLKSVKAVQVKTDDIDNEIGQIAKRITIVKDAGSQFDLLRRDFNLTRKFINYMESRSMELGRGLFRAAVPFLERKRLSESTDEFKARIKENTDKWEKLDVSFQKYINKRQEKYVPDVEFEEAFGKDFGKFFAQELAQFLPIIGFTIAGGLAEGTAGAFGGISLATGGMRRAQYSFDEATNPYAKKHSDDYKTIWSTAHGLAEGFFEAITTIPLLRAGYKIMKESSRRGMNMGMKEFYTDIHEQ